jgi:hypothetical protein
MLQRFTAETGAPFGPTTSGTSAASLALAPPYLCGTCGLPIAVNAGQLVRPCGQSCAAPIVANLSASLKGQGGAA